MNRNQTLCMMDHHRIINNSKPYVFMITWIFFTK